MTSTSIQRLTDEQLVAAATPLERVFIEASPGSGKTTVAAQRFGALRFAPTLGAGSNDDDRSVTAISFTRSATWELHRRVRQVWGPTAIRWPHRIATLDSMIYDLMSHLLQTGHIRWPGGITKLDVHDSWKVLADYSWTRSDPIVVLNGFDVSVRNVNRMQSANRPKRTQVDAAVAAGKCTHEDVRRILWQAIATGEVRAILTRRIAVTMRALIVDEVFDANELDIAVIEIAAEAGIGITIIGDPWQALYGFRGARPEAVPGLISRAKMAKLPLTRSFRWRSDAQRLLASELRLGSGVTLPTLAGNNRYEVDVVLACRWAQAWDVGDHILPLAFGSAKGNPPEAAATLLLNQLTRSALGVDATYLADALSTLQIDAREGPRLLEQKLQGVLRSLKGGAPGSLNAAYDLLVAAVSTLSPRSFPRAHHSYTSRLKLLRNRLNYNGQLVVGLTVHQSKGREWQRVGLRLAESERQALRSGLDQTNELHRQLYVACTRACLGTFEV